MGPRMYTPPALLDIIVSPKKQRVLRVNALYIHGMVRSVLQRVNRPLHKIDALLHVRSSPEVHIRRLRKILGDEVAFRKIVVMATYRMNDYLLKRSVQFKMIERKLRTRMSTAECDSVIGLLSLEMSVIACPDTGVEMSKATDTVDLSTVKVCMRTPHPEIRMAQWK